MVRVPKGITNRGLTGLDHLDLATVEDFFIDRHEVTNLEFAEFVRTGGYRKPEYWKHPFIKDGRVIPFEEAMTPLRDSPIGPAPQRGSSEAFRLDKTICRWPG